MRYISMVESPIDPLLLISDGEAVTGIHFDAAAARAELGPDCVEDDGPFAALNEQLAAYFAGERKVFDVPLRPEGTPFQRRVWQVLTTIPYGRTASYRWVAEQLGSPAAVRAVGAANGRNPISIVIPCHRVIGADGSLTGYGGGLARKRWLLEHERRMPRTVS